MCFVKSVVEKLDSAMATEPKNAETLATGVRNPMRRRAPITIRTVPVIHPECGVSLVPSIAWNP